MKDSPSSSYVISDVAKTPNEAIAGATAPAIALLVVLVAAAERPETLVFFLFFFEFFVLFFEHVALVDLVFLDDWRVFHEIRIEDVVAAEAAEATHAADVAVEIG